MADVTEKEGLQVGLMDLIVSNGKLKVSLEKAEADKKQYWNWFQDEQKKANELLLEIEKLKNKNVKLLIDKK